MMADDLAQKVEKAARIIRAGGLVAFPTETYYGFAVNPFDPEPLARLFRLKLRQAEKPILTLIAKRDELYRLASSVPAALIPLMALWPAPITLIFPGLDTLPPELTGGTGTIGVRISSHSVASALVAACRFPLTATSANISGETPCTTAGQVKNQFATGIDYILDGGTTPGGVGSTLIASCGGGIKIIREGAFPASEIAKSYQS
jgi:L-threonylcarbamoyladenylate synthase